MRAILFASAIVATFVGRRAKRPRPVPGAMNFGVADHGECAGCEQAAQISITSLGDVSALLFASSKLCFGTSPTQAKKSRPDRKALGLARLATSAIASAGPTPEISSSRLLVAWDRCQAMMLGPALAIALVASLANPRAFRLGETFSLGSGSCRNRSSKNKEKRGNITKRGDRYLRSLFTAGALAVIRYAKIQSPGTGLGFWRGGQRRWPRSR